MAPSAHNTQPWKFKIQGNSIEIFVDKKSHLSVSDPSERELYLSIGTLFTNLKVAAANFGFNIIEASGNADTVAKMTFQEEGRDESLAKLFQLLQNAYRTEVNMKKKKFLLVC